VTGPPPEELLPHVRALAQEAGAVIMGCFAEEMSVRRKADASPVSEADEAAERIILAGLAALTPDVPVVAEEAIAAGALPDISGRRFWLVDPLDGTREFLSRKGEFTVNVALIEDGRPTLGVVHAPAMELTFAAAGALPATRERAGGSPEPILARVPPAEGKVVVVSRSHSDKEALEAYLAGIRVASVVSAGSSIKFCLVACGTRGSATQWSGTRPPATRCWRQREGVWRHWTAARSSTARPASRTPPSSRAERTPERRRLRRSAGAPAGAQWRWMANGNDLKVWEFSPP
jgi:3'(2'), 5'-bisphosphate nucleotidase